MNYYQFWSDDLRRAVWLMFKELRVHPYISLKPRYLELCCPQCGRFDHDTVFDFGFDDDVSLRTRLDSFHSAEGFLCFRSSIVTFLHRKCVMGLAFKEIPSTDFFVVKVTERVEADRSVYVPSRPLCKLCGRPKGMTGVIEFRSQIQLPTSGDRFVSPVFSREGSWNRGRDIFASEDVVLALKEAGFKGGQFQRLLNAEEEAAFRAAVRKNEVYERPPGATINL
jgi:hypothetical protein